MHLTLRQLHYFREIVDAGNMTAAAARLRVAPTALSLQVKAMEDRLGVGLLKRHSRGVRPTAAGVDLYRKGKQILAMVDETERLVAPGVAAKPRTVRIGAPSSVLRVIGAETVLAAGERIEGVVVQFVEGISSDLIARMQLGQLSVVVGCELQPSESIRTLELFEERLVFATSSGDARHAVPLAEALASNLLFYGEHDACWKVVHAAARSFGLPVNVFQTVGSADVIRQMVSRGLGTAIVPFGSVEAESRRGDVAIHEIEGRPLLRRMSLAWPEKHDKADYLRSLIGFVFDLATVLHARTLPYSRLLLKRAAAP